MSHRVLSPKPPTTMSKHPTDHGITSLLLPPPRHRKASNKLLGYSHISEQPPGRALYAKLPSQSQIHPMMILYYIYINTVDTSLGPYDILAHYCCIFSRLGTIFVSQTKPLNKYSPSTSFSPFSSQPILHRGIVLGNTDSTGLIVTCSTEFQAQGRDWAAMPRLGTLAAHQRIFSLVACFD